MTLMLVVHVLAFSFFMLGVVVAAPADGTCDRGISSCGLAALPEVVNPNYQEYESLTPNEPELEDAFVQYMEELMLPASNSTIEDFVRNQKNMGPTMMQCSRVGGGGVRTFYEKAFGEWPNTTTFESSADTTSAGSRGGLGAHVGVAIRSISKIVVSTGFLALTEHLERTRSEDAVVGSALRHLSLTSTVGNFLPSCRGTSLEHESVSNLLSLSAGLDDRINLHFKLKRQEKADHVGFPSYCQIKGMRPVECVEKVVCPAYRLVTSDGPADTQHASETGTHVRGDAPIDTTWVAKVKKRPRKERKTIRSRADMVAEYEADARGELMSEEDRVNGQPLEGEDYALPNEWSLPDLSCVDTSYNCARDAKSGACHTNPQNMLLKCPLSCGLCCCLDDESMKETPDPDWLLKSQHLSGAPCILDTRNPVPMYQKKNSHHGHAAERRRQLGCTYDNYSYTVVDAMVITATGRALWEWTLDLVARPLGMSDTLRCMAAPRRRERMSAQDDGAFRDIPGCHIPPSLAKLYQPDKWPLWQGGPESYAWPGVSMFTSAADFSRFMAMILGEGTVAGVKVISRESAKEILSSKVRYTHGSCMGMEGIGLGVGTCVNDENNGSGCKAGQWWGWGGSYGSRFMIVPDAGLACVTLALMPVVNPDVAKPARYAGRQHAFAHEQAAAVRKVWREQVPPGE